MRSALLLLLPLAFTQPARAADVVVFRGARILTASGAPIERGVLVVRGGKIEAVGAEGAVPIPAGAEVRDATGKTIIPGLVDTHSHLGVSSRPGVPANSDGNEGSGAVQSALRALDAINPDDPGIRMAQAGGITTANIMPGSANVIGGQTLYVKMRGRTVEEMRLTDLPVLGGLKMANGENPKRSNWERNKRPPGTRMKLTAMQREQFVKAQEYKRQWDRYRAGPKDAAPPETDLSLEPLVEVLERKRTVHFHSHRADDLMTAARLAEEFGFELVLQHGTESYRVVDELARRKIPVSLTLVDSPGGKPEVAGLLEENAARLAKAGMTVAVNTDDPVTESRFFLRTGAIALRGGMTETEALQALTINPAKMMHLDTRLGSLAKGKDADFVVLSGAPFSIYTQVLETYIDGVKVYDRARPRDLSYLVGGFALADSSRLPRPAALVPPQPKSAAPPLPEGAKPPQGGEKRVAVLAGRLYTVGKGTIENGALLLEDGKITYAGPRAGLVIPAGTPVLSAAAATPGLIDVHSVVGLSGALNVVADQDQDEMSDPNQADLRVLDGFNPVEPLLEFLRTQGITVLHALPGRKNVIAGQSAIFRTAGTSAEKMALRTPAGLVVNLGEEPKAAYPGKLPTTRMGTASLVRAAFVQARDYARKAAAADESKRPPRNLKLEALAAALEGKVPVIFSAHRADDLHTALRIAREFRLKAILDLATEGYLVADAIAAAKVPVFVHPTMQRAAGEMQTLNSHLGNAAALAERKIPLALGTGFEGYVPKTRVVRYEAGMAMVNGMGFDRALASITLDAAKLLGIADRFGSLEQGKAADVVLYDGDPFEHATHVTHTLIDGRVVYDREAYLKLPFERRALPLLSGEGGCCLFLN